jgi:hypothetical protein
MLPVRVDVLYVNEACVQGVMVLGFISRVWHLVFARDLGFTSLSHGRS